MKIVHWIKQFYPYMGGGETALYELSKAIEKDKKITKNVIITSRLPGTKEKEKLFRKTLVHRIGKPVDYNKEKHIRLLCKTTIRDLSLYNALKQHVDDNTVIHVHGPTPAPFIFRKLKKIFEKTKHFRPWERFGVPIIMHYHAESLVDKEWLAERDYKHSSKIIYVDRTIGKVFKNKNKAVFIPNGIDLAEFKPPKQRGRKVLFAGRIYKAKGWRTFVEAVKGMKNTVVIGHGEEEEELKKIFDGQYLGKVDNKNLSEHYKKSSIVVCPYEHVGFTRVVMEAMACGCITIKSDYDPEHAPIKHEVNGFIFRTGDAKQLKELINEILEMPEQKRRIIRMEAVRTARKNFDIKKLSNQVIMEYKNLLKRTNNF
jgi:glycosyltransferase involved in cell wall biosynthesis